MPKMPSLIQITPNCIKAGLYLHYEGCIYRVTDTDDLRIRIVSDDDPNLKYLEILKFLRSDSRDVFVGSFAEIDTKGSIGDESYRSVEQDIPNTFLRKADVIISLVEGFAQYLESSYQQSGAELGKREILDTYLAQSPICQSRSTYYRFKKLYDVGEGNLLRIASQLRRRPRRPLSNS
jgi:hypothetical protein